MMIAGAGAAKKKSANRSVSSSSVSSSSSSSSNRRMKAPWQICGRRRKEPEHYVSHELHFA